MPVASSGRLFPIFQRALTRALPDRASPCASPRLTRGLPLCAPPGSCPPCWPCRRAQAERHHLGRPWKLIQPPIDVALVGQRRCDGGDVALAVALVGQRRCDGGDVALAVVQRRCGASCGAAKQRRHPWPTMMGFAIAMNFAISMTMSFGFANGSSRSWRLKEAPQSKRQRMFGPKCFAGSLWMGARIVRAWKKGAVAKRRS